MSLLLICHEDYNISDFVSEFESMGIDVSVNLNAFNFASLGNKRVREVGGLSVVTFSTNFYKPSHVLQTSLGYCGSPLWSLDLWTSEYRFGPSNP